MIKKKVEKADILLKECYINAEKDILLENKFTDFFSKIKGSFKSKIMAIRQKIKKVSAVIKFYRKGAELEDFHFSLYGIRLTYRIPLLPNERFNLKPGDRVLVRLEDGRKMWVNVSDYWHTNMPSLEKEKLIKVLGKNKKWTLPLKSPRRKEFEKEGNTLTNATALLFDMLWANSINLGWTMERFAVPPNLQAEDILAAKKVFRDQTERKLNWQFELDNGEPLDGYRQSGKYLVFDENRLKPSEEFKDSFLDDDEESDLMYNSGDLEESVNKKLNEVSFDILKAFSNPIIKIVSLIISAFYFLKPDINFMKDRQNRFMYLIISIGNPGTGFTRTQRRQMRKDSRRPGKTTKS